MSGEAITCSDCGSRNWKCIDESNEWFRDSETGELIRLPVGYLVCQDCGSHFIDADWVDATYIGDDKQAGLVE